MRLVAIVAVALCLAGCSSPAPGTVDAVPRDDAPVVAFYGDSYTRGTGASDPAARWSTIVCEQRGWTEFNPSANGLGFINNRHTIGDGDLPSLIIEQEPDIVIVTMGLNDNFAYSYAGDKIQQQIEDDLRRLKEALPNARIVVVEPFWYKDERPDSVEIINGWVRDAAANLPADYISGASRWIEGHPEWMAVDRLHPNDEGYAEIAKRMDAELTKLGLSPLLN